jgi:TldD protein
MIALLASMAFAADWPGFDLSQPLLTEMARADSLHLDGAPKLYHLRYHAWLLEQSDAVASFGSLISHGEDPFAAVGIELRIGTPKYDNTGFGGWQNGFGLTWLAQRPTPHEVQTEVWRLTDNAYKQAVEQYARKQAQFTAPPDYPGDYLLTGPQVADLGVAPKEDPVPLQALAKKLSAASLGLPAVDLAMIERSEAYLGQEAGSHLIIDTEGTKVRTPAEECTIRVIGHARSADGLLLTDSRLWTVRRPDQLPKIEVMSEESEKMFAGLAAAAKAPPLEEEYVGPVLFEDGAAVDLFRYLLTPQLEGTPAEVPFESFFGDLTSTSGTSVRIGRRVLPPGWAVHDNPKLHPDLPSSFERDGEGTPAEDVKLVSDGIVRTLLMSRVPRKEISASNGHARGSLGERGAGRAAQLEVTPAKAVAKKKLYKTALKLAQSYGRSWVMVVRRLQEPAVRALAGISDSTEGPSLPEPVVLVKHFLDGHEELVRGAQFSGVHRWVLRDVAAAGANTDGSYMAPSQSGGSFSNLQPTEGLPTFLSVPTVLIGEMELVPQPGDPREVPVITPPDPPTAR